MKALIVLSLGLLLLNACASTPPTSSSRVDGRTYTVKHYTEKHAKGLKRTPESMAWLDKKKTEAQKKFKLYKAVPLPAFFNIPKSSSPLDQGSCGDCWNFSIFKAFWSEFLLNGYTMVQPAANYLLNNCSGISDANEYGCGGGDFPAGEGEKHPAVGTWAESQDPYTGRSGRCMKGLKALGFAIEWNIVGDGNNPPTFQQLAQVIYNGGHGHMVSVDVDASSGNWENYHKGIYNDNAGCNIDHMIDATGYTCQTSVDSSGHCVFNAQGQPVNGDGYLKVQNNWSTSWGENGYMKTRYGMNCIAQTAMYFEVNPEPKTLP